MDMSYKPAMQSGGAAPTNSLRSAATVARMFYAPCLEKASPHHRSTPELSPLLTLDCA